MCFYLSRDNSLFIKFAENEKWSWQNWYSYLYFLLVVVSFRLREADHTFTASRKTKTARGWGASVQGYVYLPYSDVKNVASNRAGHSHVPESLPGHNDTGDKIRDGSPSRQDGQTHDLFTDANCLSNLKVMTGTK